MTFELLPLVTQLTKNHGATIALAKATLSEDDFTKFLIESEIQANHSMLDFINLFPDIVTNKETAVEIVNKNIETLKDQRDSLKNS